MPPIIGITCEFEEYQPQPGKDKSYVKLYHHYYHAISRAGGLPLLLPVFEKPETVLQLLDSVDGVMLSGGDDYPPTRFGEDTHPRTRFSPPWRAEQDLLLADHLLNGSDKPVLAICAGVQALAIADGGTLLQDIPLQAPDAINHLAGATHRLEVEPESRLARSLGEFTTVNSFHHQAVREVGRQLRVVARTSDGVIEAVELPDARRYLVGVEWHPELMVNDQGARRLFADFVAACG